jgi:hypothetical protein
MSRIPSIALTGLLAGALLAGGLPAPAAAACADVAPVGLLPDGAACAWTRDGEPIVATTLEELMEVIDGGAMIYDQYGFVAAAFQNYLGEVSGEPSTLTVSLFNQETGTNAAALYDDPGSGSGDPVPDWSGSGDARYRVAFGYLTLEFWEACFYGSLVFAAGGADALSDATCLAGLIVGSIQQATPSRPQNWGAVKAAYR